MLNNSSKQKNLYFKSHETLLQAFDVWKVWIFKKKFQLQYYDFSS